MSIYKSTATKAINSKTNAIYAFGREKSLDGQPIELGGYKIYTLKNRFYGREANLVRKWELVECKLSFKEAIAMMNKKVHHIAYKEV